MKKNPLKVIKNIKSLDDLSKHDVLIRNYAYGIVESELADDIVNTAYLKIDRALKKVINTEPLYMVLKQIYIDQTFLSDCKFKTNSIVIDGGYVAKALKHTYIDHNRKYSKICNVDYLEHTLEYIDDFDDNVNDKMSDELLYDEMDIRIDTLSWYEKQILELSKEISLLELSRQSKISYRSLCYSKHKIDDKLGIIK